jgi:hypothetical protein
MLTWNRNDWEFIVMFPKILSARVENASVTPNASAVPLTKTLLHSHKIVAMRSFSSQLLALGAIAPCMVWCQCIRRSEQPASRNLLIGQEFFRSKDPAVLGALNLAAGMNNPLKGLIGGARWATPPLLNTVPLSMEWYNMGLDEMMVGDNKFDWKIIDGLLEGSASRNMHAVFSVFIHWPGRPLRLPPHLKDIQLYDTDSGKSPNYADPRVLKALEQYIVALGARYDGDKRIGAIHVGLLGFYGEGHTFPTKGLVPDEVAADVASWYRRAFTTTQIQARYPGPEADELGLYDGSLFYTTLDGTANGGVTKSWYTWPRIVKAGQQDAWKKHMIAGETGPRIAAELFANSYPAGTYNHQDIKLTIDTLHLSWILHHGAFSSGGYTGDTLQNARKWHAYLGYAFQVTEVAASASASASGADMDVTVKQAGVAPFYYDLDLVLECEGLPAPLKQGGVHELIEQGQSKTFSFKGVPVTPECLQHVSITLDSSYAYRGRPVQFAQGTSGTVVLQLPLPPLTPKAAPISVPIAVPTRAPEKIWLPTAAPRTPPSAVSTPAPVAPSMTAPAVVPSPLAVPATTLFFVDADPTRGPRFSLSSSTTFSSVDVNIDGISIYQGDLFRQHRWRSGGFTYSISGFTPGSNQAITLGFAETYQRNCDIGKRVFSVVANGATLWSNLDIFAIAGCKGPYVTTQTATVNALGNIELTFVPIRQNPFMSFIDISPEIAESIRLPTIAPASPPTAVSTPVPVVPSATAPVLAPSPVAVPDTTAFFVDADSTSGPRFSLSRSTTFSYIKNNIAGISNYQGDLFRQHRWRSGGFTYTISGFTPGSNQAIALGFAETYQRNCGVGKRVFSVVANGVTLWSNLDIFAVAGCKAPYVATKTATANALGKIELTFVSNRQNPFVSFIDIALPISR